MNRLRILLTTSVCLCLGSFFFVPPRIAGQGQQPTKADEPAKDAWKRIADLRAKLTKIGDELYYASDDRKDSPKEDNKAESKKIESEADAEKRHRRVKLLEVEQRETFVALFAALADAPNPPTGHDDLILMGALQEPIGTRGLQDVTLKTAIEFASDKFAGNLPIFVDQHAFLVEKGSGDIWESKINLPTVTREMPLGAVLQILMTQVGDEDVQAAFMIRRGQIEIVPASRATAKYLLTEPVMARFKDRPLQLALNDLSDRTGLTINLDPAVGEKKNTYVNATFRNTSLQDALVVATEMAGLKFVVLHDSVYVTTPDKVAALEKEQKTREEQRPAVKVKTPAVK